MTGGSRGCDACEPTLSPPPSKVRRLALATGATLVTIAFLAGGRVADTREGLVFEVIALLAGLAGVSLVLYGWVAASTRAHAGTPHSPVALPPRVRIRSANELLIGAGGLVVAAVLVTGIGFSAGLPWALMGLILLLPMVIGSAYLCLRFLLAPQREWKIDLGRLTNR
jgi:hypothetical protein